MGKSKYLIPILIVALVVCIGVLIFVSTTTEKAADVELEDRAMVIVNEVSPAEPVSDQTTSEIPPPDGVLQVEDESATQYTEAIGATTDEGMYKGLIAQKQEKLDRRTTELADMRSMLEVLIEQEDTERIAQYRELITKTESEIKDLRNDISRYNDALKE